MTVTSWPIAAYRDWSDEQREQIWDGLERLAKEEGRILILRHVVDELKRGHPAGPRAAERLSRPRPLL